MLSATNHGPIALADLNHTALSQAQNMYVPYGPAVRKTCDPVFVAYATPVPVMSTNWGGRSYCGVTFAWRRCPAVVGGIGRWRIASVAPTGRATGRRPPPMGDSGGISWNAAGSE